MKDFFKPDDFRTFFGEDKITVDEAAVDANRKLNQLIESCVLVYSGDDFEWHKLQKPTDRFQGRLCFVEPIVKEPCTHPLSHLVTLPKNPHKAYCGICNVELQATWSEEK